MTERVRLQRPNVFTRWRANPIAFIEEVLCDPETGEPFTPTRGRAHFPSARLQAR
jgi:hypothetical protein